MRSEPRSPVTGLLPVADTRAGATGTNVVREELDVGFAPRLVPGGAPGRRLLEASGLQESPAGVP